MYYQRTLRERLAKLEHEQWMHWSKYVADNYDIPEELEDKWQESWKPYEELSEGMKDKDRIWADKAIDEFKRHKWVERVHSIVLVIIIIGMAFLASIYCTGCI